MVFLGGMALIVVVSLIRRPAARTPVLSDSATRNLFDQVGPGRDDGEPDASVVGAPADRERRSGMPSDPISGP